MKTHATEDMYVMFIERLFPIVKKDNKNFHQWMKTKWRIFIQLNPINKKSIGIGTCYNIEEFKAS